MTAPFRLQTGNPRPAGLERIAVRLERVSGAPTCSMKAIGICESRFRHQPADDSAILRVVMKEAGKKDAITYYLCHACADASGDLRELGLNVNAESWSTPFPRSA